MEKKKVETQEEKKSICMAGLGPIILHLEAKVRKMRTTTNLRLNKTHAVTVTQQRTQNPLINKHGGEGEEMLRSVSEER